MFTENQINALKFLILLSRVGTDLSKRIMLFLIDQSKGLTESVCFTLMVGREGYTATEIHEAAGGVDAMSSINCPTHIDEVMLAMGSEMGFCMHYGDFDPNRGKEALNTDGQFPGMHGLVINPGAAIEGMPLRYTFWLSKEFYSPTARYLTISRAELEKVELKKPDLKYGRPLVT